MTNTTLLETKINDSGLKKKYLAKMLGLSAYALTSKIRNDREFKVSEVDVLCELLGIDSLEERQQIFFARK